MNKNDLIHAVSEESGLSQKDAKAAVTATINAISTALQNEDSVQLVGFGTFSVVQRAEKKGVNPATKEQITIPACKAVKFKAGAALKAAVN